jgi:hypothetical protein
MNAGGSRSRCSVLVRRLPRLALPPARPGRRRPVPGGPSSPKAALQDRLARRRSEQDVLHGAPRCRLGGAQVSANGANSSFPRRSHRRSCRLQTAAIGACPIRTGASSLAWVLGSTRRLEVVAVPRSSGGGVHEEEGHQLRMSSSTGTIQSRRRTTNLTKGSSVPWPLTSP